MLDKDGANMSFDVWNRRYTGSKYKLADWIVELVNENCIGDSFCDIFAGTSIVAARMLPHIRKLYLNDLLFSNEVIYKAFYLQDKFNNIKVCKYAVKYASLTAENITDNYMSENFGDKFFSYDDAKIIGFIREDIKASTELNEKERAILVASLLYSADKSANTVGHYDAFIKGKSIKNKFSFQLISPMKITGKKISITRKDANLLANELECDIVYIDPPYNSRQYSRFYHILENITKWQKPNLAGVALKPPSENMSEYCRSKAKNVFKDLIENLKCKYIVVSYNNTYSSKSKSSRNKIEIKDMIEILKKKGALLKFEKEHQFFNAGKTKFSNHKEFVFIVKVGEKNEY